MSAADLFEGFAARTASLEGELADLYGEGVREHFADARERTQDWSRTDYLDAKAAGEDLDARTWPSCTPATHRTLPK